MTAEIASHTGWVRCAQSDPWHHWADAGKSLCGVPVPLGAHLLSTQPTNPNGGHIGPNSFVRACRTCLTEQVRRTFDLPYRVGSYVQSRAERMQLYGQVVEMFVSQDNLPMLNITRIWLRPPQEITIRGYDVFDHDTNPHDWYRFARECRPWEGPGKPRPKKPRRPTPTPLFSEPGMLPPDQVRRRLDEIKQQFRRR